MEYSIPSNFNNFRLTKVLSKITGAPIIFLLKLLRKKEILVNNIKVNKDVRIKAGDFIKLKKNIKEFAERKKTKNNYIDKIKPYVFYEDLDLIVLNKPDNIASQGGTKVGINISDAYGDKALMVHRLDRKTTGVLILAKNILEAQKIGEKFRLRTIKKVYLAVLDGVLERDIVCQDKIDNKQACSIFSILRVWGNNTLVKVELVSGRKHQIRKHANGLGFPILGDIKYGKNKDPHMFLHCLMIKYDKKCFWAIPNLTLWRDFLGSLSNMTHLIQATNIT